MIPATQVGVRLAYRESHVNRTAAAPGRFTFVSDDGRAPMAAAEFARRHAAAETHKKAERAIRKVLAAYLESHPGRRSAAQVRVARFSDRPKREVTIVGVAAMIGARRSATKARASRANGRLGGRPRKTVATARRAKSAR